MTRTPSPLDRALLALEKMEAKLAAAERARSEPIAIVGMGCRFPGGASDPATFAAKLRAGYDAIREVPPDRWTTDFGDGPGRRGTRWAGFIDGVEDFDAGFFGISPREAQSLDPQQRLLLEVAWEALEHAGIAADQLEGTATGVFVGISNTDYTDHATSVPPQQMDAYFATGNAACFAAGRLAYTLGLQGPTLSVDTACSSSLVATHLACGSLRNGECDAALVGGVNLILSPLAMHMLSRTQALSSDGRCRAFDARANGFVRGEGCGVVVLKRLSDARADGDRVWAVVRGSAVNQDGRSTGLTTPNVLAQEALLLQAIQRAGVSPASIGYVEAHGTGTPLGDPIEMEALVAVLGQAGDRRCPVGSVKSNVGHLEAAAGVAGLIKTVLSLSEGEVFPHLHFETLNPRIRLAGSRLEIAEGLSAWADAPRVAGVSSFSMSGTNAHVVLEAGDDPVVQPALRPNSDGHLLVVSAKTETALLAQARRMAAATRALPAAELCATAAQGRVHHAHRLAVIGEDGAALACALEAFVEGEAGARTWHGVSDPDRRAPAPTGGGLAALAAAHVGGAQIDWAGVQRSRRPVVLPSYPFERRRHWLALAPLDAASPSDHPLLGTRRAVAGKAVLFEASWPGQLPAYVSAHRVGDQAAAPATFLLALAHAAVREVVADAGVDALEILRPLLVDGVCTVQVVVEPGPAKVAVHSFDGDRWRTHAVGQIAPRTQLDARVELAALTEACPDLLVPAALYARWAALGIQLGESCRVLTEVRTGGMQSLAQAALPDAIEAVAGLHPLLLDAALHVLGASREDVDTTFLPVSVARYTAGNTRTRRVGIHSRYDPALQRGEALLFDDAGVVLGRLEGVQVQALGAPAGPETGSQVAALLHRLIWRQAAAPPHVQLSGACLVVSNRKSSCELLGSTLPGAGLQVEDTADTGQRLADRVTGTDDLAQVVFDWDGADALEVALGLVQALVAADRPTRLVAITRHAHAVDEQGVDLVQAQVAGFFRAVALERGELRVCVLDVDEDAPVAGEVLAGAVDQVAHRRGRRFVGRLSPGATQALLQPPEAEPWRLARSPRCTLDGLALRGYSLVAPGPGQVEILIEAAGLNFRDVLNALGMYPGEAGPLGVECAGTVGRVGDGVQGLTPGDPVIALGTGAFGARMVTDARFVAPRPTGMDPEAAATIPVAFVTAWAALHDLAAVCPGERVLIHAAAGGVGMAAVQVARRAGAEVLGTASPAKHSVVRGLGVAGVMSSRAPGFGQVIEAEERGVHVALNSLTGPFIPETLRALAPGGRFVELGKTEIWDEARARAEPGAAPDLALHHLDIAELDPDRVQVILQAVVAAFDAGELRPLPRRVFALADARAAFGVMSRAEHVGKVVLRPPRRWSPDPDGTYLITGGLGAIGLHVAKWLVQCGARHLTLLGRSAPSEAAIDVISELKDRGAHVQVARADVTDRRHLLEILDDVQSQAGLRGVFHVAGAKDDGAVQDQSWARFEQVHAAKALGAGLLHTLTRDLALDCFVLFSSAASTIGSPGQTGYAAANAYLDALAHQRRAEGLPAVSVAWGPWAGAGMAADTRQGLLPKMAPADALAALQAALDRGDVQVSAFDFDRGSSRARAVAERTPLLKGWLDPPPRVEPESPQELEAQIRRAAAGILMVDDPEEIDPDRPLSDLGFDSLMAMEMRNAMAELVGRPLPASLVFDYPTVRALAEHLRGARPPAPTRQPVVALPGDDSIAIIGIGCRFPGGASDPERFWRLLVEGRDAITDVPPDRWDVDAFYDPDPEVAGRMYTRRGGFLEGVDRFDAAFFGISPREAVSMDPQQRLLLEVTWEALEHAGVAPDGLSGTSTGVFTGICGNDYAELALHGRGVVGLDTYSGTGNAFSVAAGRLSYLLGLHGPSLPVDTACSSSLVAVHLACRSLLAGESDLALASGVNVILSPASTIYFCRMRALAPDGRCKTFDAAADGYVRSEGCGVVVLKRLSSAQADGDRVIAVVRGSAVNHDGRSNGLTAPNGPAQEAVLRSALAQAGLQAGEVDYLEAHGTGTSLGDPIELRAAAAVLGEGRSSARPLLGGSVKTNIGHTEGAAGIAGLIKAALMVERGVVPASLHFSEPNPHIPWSTLPVEVASRTTAWPDGAPRRVAGVSSFGFSGTNAHVLVESAPAPAPAPTPTVGAAQFVLPLSAKTLPALGVLTERMLALLSAASDEDVPAICRTAAVGRAHFAHRVAVVGADAQTLAEALRSPEVAAAAVQSASEPMSGAAVLARRYVAGEAVDWATQTASYGQRVATLPTYPWQGARHWIDPAPAQVPESAHPLIGLASTLAATAERGRTRCWQRSLAVEDLPYLSDHRVEGRAVLPASAFAEIAGVAAGGPVADLELRAPLLWPSAGVVTLQATLEGAAISVSSRTEDAAQWTLHATATRATAVARGGDAYPLSEVRGRCRVERSAASLYQGLAASGLDYGPSFQGVSELVVGEGEALAQVVLRTGLDPSGYRVHPALLDAAFQVMAAASAEDAGAVFVPAGLARFAVLQDPGARAHVHVVLRDSTDDRRVADVRLLDDAGRVLVDVGGLSLRRLKAARRADPVLRLEWIDAPIATEPDLTAGRWLIVGESGASLTTGLSVALAARAQQTIVVDPAASLGRVAAIRDALSAGGGWRGVVHVPSFGADAPASAEASCAEALDLLHAVAKLGWRDPPRVWVVTRGAQPSSKAATVRADHGAAWALYGTVALEQPDLRACRIDVSESPADVEVAAVVEELLTAGKESAVSLRRGQRRVARLCRGNLDDRQVLAPAGDRAFRVESTRAGSLDNLALVAFARQAPGPGEVEIEVEAASLNFLDVMKALGIYPGAGEDPPLGNDCAGRVVRRGPGVEHLEVGDRVAAVASSSLATHAVCPARFAVPLTDAMGASDAASIPTVFATAWYALHHVARLRRGERVLIHSAAGGTGLAALQVALHLGAEVLATAGSPRKRALLNARGVACVMDSRSYAFVDEVRAHTGGEGVDVVLNSLAGEAIEHSLSVLAPDGRFVELGKRDIYADRALSLSAFKRSLTYSAVDLAGLASRRPERFAALLREVFDAFSSGVFQTTPIERFSAPRVVEAFQSMARAEHVGKLVVTFDEPSAVPIRRRAGDPGLLAAATYLITGGLGALGLQLARWLAEHGARRLILTSRSGQADPAAIAAIEGAGAAVEAVACDVTDRAALRRLIDGVGLQSELRGVIHAAGVLDDGLLGDHTQARMSAVLAPKVLGAWNLHTATAGLPLDFFVLYGSAASMIGAPGQGPYAAANGFLAGLAHQRRCEGLTACCLEWGPFAGSGMAGDSQAAGARIAARGFEPIEPEAGHVLLGRALAADEVQVGLMQVDLRRWLAFHPVASRLPLLSRLHGPGGTAPTARALARIRGAAPGAQRAALLALVTAQVASVLAMSPDALDPEVPLDDLGVDSLTGLDLRNRIEADLGISLQATMVWSFPNVAAVSEHLAEQLGLQCAEDAVEAEVKALSDAELEAALEAELAATDGEVDL